MRTVQVELPDRLAEELETLIRVGWFRSEEELIRMALLEFIRNHRLELTERFQLEDIEWALQQKDK